VQPINPKKEEDMKPVEQTVKSFERDNIIKKLQTELYDSLKVKIDLYDDLQAKKVLLLKKEREISNMKTQNQTLMNRVTELENKIKEESKAKPNIGIKLELPHVDDDIGIEELLKKKNEEKEEFIRKEKDKVAKTLDSIDKSFKRDKEINKLKSELSYSLKVIIGLYGDLQTMIELLLKKERDISNLKTQNQTLINKITELESQIKTLQVSEVSENKKDVRESVSKSKTEEELGYEYLCTGKYHEAIQSYMNVIKINPKYAEAYYNIGYAFFEIGELDDSIQFYQKAIELRPNDADVYYNMGIVYEKSGNQSVASECFQKAKELREKK